jgi:hypothetical protein
MTTNELVEKMEYQHTGRNERVSKEAERFNSLRKKAEQVGEQEVADKISDAMAALANGLAEFEEALSIAKDNN